MNLQQEIWLQDQFEEDLWAGENGLLVNTAALHERADYFQVVRVPARPAPVADYELAGEHTS